MSTENPEDEVVILADAGAAAVDDVVVLDESKPADKLPEGAEKQPDGSVIYTLMRPVTLRYRGTVGGAVTEQVLETLRLYRLTGADMRAVMAAGKETAVMVACAKSARMNEARWNAFFDRMDGADAGAIGEVIETFLERGRPTGR